MAKKKRRKLDSNNIVVFYNEITGKTYKEIYIPNYFNVKQKNIITIYNKINNKKLFKI